MLGVPFVESSTRTEPRSLGSFHAETVTVKTANLEAPSRRPALHCIGGCVKVEFDRKGGYTVKTERMRLRESEVDQVQPLPDNDVLPTGRYTRITIVW